MSLWKEGSGFNRPLAGLDVRGANHGFSWLSRNSSGGLVSGPKPIIGLWEAKAYVEQALTEPVVASAMVFGYGIGQMTGAERAVTILARDTFSDVLDRNMVMPTPEEAGEIARQYVAGLARDLINNGFSVGRTRFTRRMMARDIENLTQDILRYGLTRTHF